MTQTEKTRRDREQLQAAVGAAVSAYTDRNPRSREMFARAQQSLPGGNTRTGTHMDPFPFYADRGEGVLLFDLDGHPLLDFVNNNTALILGHAHPAVVQALQQQLPKGTGFPRPQVLEVEMAELLRERIPSLERLRFCSSGTEAVLNALRTARAFTGRHKTAKFEGAYHGIDEHAMVSFLPPLGPELGPDDRPRSVSSTAGLTSAVTEDVLVLPFNDLAACESIIGDNAGDLAAVIVDPVSTGAGLALPEGDFLKGLLEIAHRAGALVIFDEIVSFRTSAGGAQAVFDVVPDLTCLGKVVAGGTPGGVFGGRADLMALYDPASGPPAIPQSGTFNANPFALNAGLATLRAMTTQAYEKLDSLTAVVVGDLQTAFDAAGVSASVIAVGSIFRVYFLPEAPRNYRQAAADDSLLQRWLHFSLLNRDIYWRDGGNLSLPMEREHVDHLTSAVRDCLRELQ